MSLSWTSQSAGPRQPGRLWEGAMPTSETILSTCGFLATGVRYQRCVCLKCTLCRYQYSDFHNLPGHEKMIEQFVMEVSNLNDFFLQFPVLALCWPTAGSSLPPIALSRPMSLTSESTLVAAVSALSPVPSEGLQSPIRFRIPDTSQRKTSYEYLFLIYSISSIDFHTIQYIVFDINHSNWFHTITEQGLSKARIALWQFYVRSQYENNWKLIRICSNPK